PGERARDPRLHLAERLAVGKSERARMTLHDVPFRNLAQVIGLLPCPPPDVELEQPALDPDRHTPRAGNRPRGLARSFERRRVNRGHALDLRDARSRFLRMLLPVITKVQPWPPPRKN